MKCAFALLPCLFMAAALAAQDTLRIKYLQRCDDLLGTGPQLWCLRTQGLGPGTPAVWLGDTQLPGASIERQGDTLKLKLDASRQRSAPLWIESAGQKSNPVWLTRQRSHVVAAGPHEVAKNMDGLTTYLDLVSLLIEEKHDGERQARRIADKYGAQVVGAIPPLNVYQLRLPVRDLVQRDAMILRMGSETSVDAVIIEESAPERGEEGGGRSAGALSQADEWAANRFMDALYYYQRRVPAASLPVKPVRIGVIEREVDFDAPAFAGYRGPCAPGRTCLYARDGERAESHGSHVAGILAAQGEGVQGGFLPGLGKPSPGFEVIVERNADAGVTANIAASVNLVEDGARVLNWSWGIHRVGTKDVAGDEVDSLVRSGLAMSGYEELLEEFFLWLRARHPDVVVVNSAGNGASWSGTDEYRLPSSFITEQLLVVGGHQRSDQDVPVEDPAHVRKRRSSNIDMRVDVSAAACLRAAQARKAHCGTSYATPLVTATVAAMLSINPDLTPEQLRMLLRRSALTLGTDQDFEAMDAEDLTAPILPSERNGRLNHPDLGRSARLDMQRALDLAVQSRERVR
ncbi:S8/S53 family peptidase [Pseudomonas sp. S 311-6]|uniref:S8/S53 family peptidase n=1 Tax=Pseudomonas TaxID=286 RepID=UPI001CE3C1B5|nr:MULTISPECIES: S8/S53 family peptidase [Pseudomonas]MCO7564426.1 S8/S53 family peptidase [Pseudomonas mosselii]MCO7615828.1 S8/S53 family peptidase [Pseudomonas guariconensis]MCO7638705.1 S8/S53 family peptidase [Pseudomonas sp. S 311-6]